MADQSQGRRGDRVAIYKYKGRDSYRGIVSLGEVLTDPQTITIPPGTDPYEVIRSYGRTLRTHAQWSWVRYVRAPRLPLWADLGSGSVVDELAVAWAQEGRFIKSLPSNGASHRGSWPDRMASG
jgi:hypothetical protein